MIATQYLKRYLRKQNKGNLNIESKKENRHVQLIMNHLEEANYKMSKLHTGLKFWHSSKITNTLKESAGCVGELL